MSTDFTVWVGAIMTIGAFSYLFKENQFYKGVEHIYVGVAAGYTIVMGYSNIVAKVWQPVTQKGQVLVLVPFSIGLLLFAPFVSSQYRWVRRIPLAFITGIGAGLTIRTAVLQQLIRQIDASIVPINSIDSLIIILGVVVVLCYFFFTLGSNPAVKGPAEAGKWVMMVMFGAAFGNAVMGRISLLIGRAQFMFGDWIHLIKQ
jgi:hypothetical protein